MNILVAHENMDEKTAYNIVKTIFDKKADLVAVHKEAEQLQAGEPEEGGHPDAVPSGRGQVLRGKGRQAELTPGMTGNDHQAERAQLSADIDAAALQKAEEYIEQEEGAANKLKGWLAAFVTLAAVVMSVFHLYTAYAIVPTQTLRPVHVAFVLFLCFLVFPVGAALSPPHHVVGLDRGAARHRRGRAT